MYCNDLKYEPLNRESLDEHREAIKSKLEGKGREWLCDALRRCLSRMPRRRHAAYVISEELTRRDIPPAFRGYPEHDPDDLELAYDLLTYDLQWLVAKYPEHRPIRARWRWMFTEARQITSEAVGVLNNGRRERWEIAQNLGLAEEQQFECHWIRSGKVAHAKELIRNKERKYRHCFADQFYQGQQCGMSDEQKMVGIKRRLNIWICAEMLGWDKPSKIARWYKRMTGEEITRAIVSVQLKRIPRRLQISSSPTKHESGA